ncbi:MAG: GNAT family N-acetyltransferase [Xanthobacteraceae bacterium]
MASTEAARLTPVAEDSIPGCMALSAEAGWNQTPDDWAVFVRRGTVFGLLDGGAPVASGAILPYANDFAWISMVLVTAKRRRERIGTRILETCCAEIARRGLVAMLDATPAGERVYRPLGFEPMFGLTRWQGQGGGGSAKLPAGIRPMTKDDMDAVFALDAAAFGAHRHFLLEGFLRREPQLAFVTAEEGRGFALARSGRLATQIGPIIAADEDAAATLLSAAVNSVRGPVFLDLADRWSGIARQLQQRGFTVQRPFLRMGMRRHVPFGDVARTFVIAGPEFG